MKNIIVYLCFLFLLLLAACSKTRSYKDELDFVYNWGCEFSAIKNPELYEPKIKEEIHYFEYPEFSFKNEHRLFLKAKSLMFAYGRLFVIEDAKKNLYKAEIYLQKTRYWYIVMLQCLGDKTPREIDEKAKGLTKNEIRRSILALNPVFYKKVGGRNIKK